MKKLLLADASEVFCQALVSALGDGYQVHVCTDGIQAMKMLEQCHPDVLVADLALSGVDGLALLQAAAKMTDRPALLATSRLNTPFIEAAVSRIGVDYMIIKPCDITCLTERIRDLSGDHGQQKTLLHPTSELAALLAALNINAGRSGYGYLMRIIEMYLDDPNRSLTKDLYPAAGRARQTNGLAVERAIRGVIENAWLRRDDTIWKRYFPVDSKGCVARPTNKAFITALAMALRAQKRKWA